MRVVFIGTDDIGEIALRRLAESHHEIALVISQPDRPKGRGRKIEPGLVAAAANELGIPLIQPVSIKDEDARQRLTEASPDIIAVVSYGEYIPRKIFEAPKYGSINVHPSLLPRWRGASPVRYTLLAGDTVAGVTIQYLHKKMDAGDILLQEEIPVEPDDNHGSLCKKLYPLGAELLVRALDGLEDGTLTARPQDESKVTKAPKIEKNDLWLDWTKAADEVRNRIRAFAPTPGARTLFRNKDYKILAASKDLVEIDAQYEPGQVASITDEGPAVMCADKALVLTSLQPSGKKPISGRDFINGYRVETGETFMKRSDV
jgi:methionyl-tRNA formyltransferase